MWYRLCVASWMWKFLWHGASYVAHAMLGQRVPAVRRGRRRVETWANPRNRLKANQKPTRESIVWGTSAAARSKIGYRRTGVIIGAATTAIDTVTSAVSDRSLRPGHYPPDPAARSDDRRVGRGSANARGGATPPSAGGAGG